MRLEYFSFAVRNANSKANLAQDFHPRQHPTFE